ncbi:hypothetical protein LguiB_006074 [Lonicera macranthoides]
MVMCACVFFNCSSTRSSPTSLGGGDFSASIGGGWYTFPERVICCIQRDVGSDPSEVSDDSGSADQLKVPREVSVIQIVSLWGGQGFHGCFFLSWVHPIPAFPGLVLIMRGCEIP